MRELLSLFGLTLAMFSSGINAEFNMVGPSYQKSVRPDDEGVPTNVTVNVYIRSAVLNEKTQELETILTFRMSWKDPRLQNPVAWNPSEEQNPETQPKFLVDSRLADEIWTPDIFFGNEKSASFHNVLTKNIMVRISPDGNVFLSVRISLNLLCKLQYANFPFDQQTCNITIESYGLDTTKLLLFWNETNPVTKSSSEMGNYMMTDIQNYSSTPSVVTGTYARLTIQLKAQHIGAPTVYRFFLPAAIFTMMSWMAFYIHPEDITVRVILGVLGIASTSILGASSIFVIPASSITSVDVWSLATIILGALVLFESAIVNLIYRATSLKSSEEKPLGFNSERSTIYSLWASRLDFFSRIAFPVLYSVFNVIFWSVHLNS